MLTKFKVILLLSAIFLVRPSALSQNSTTIYAICISGFCLLLHMMEKFKTKDISFTKKNFIVLVTSLLLWMYLIFQATFTNSNQYDFALKSTIAHVVLIIIFSIILSDKKSNYLFFRWFIIFLIANSISYCVTYVLSLFINLAKLHIFTIPINGYQNATPGFQSYTDISQNYTSGEVFFPFTVLYNLYTVYGQNVALPRFLSLFRESGILQAFLIWAIFNLKAYNLDRKWIKLFLFAGVIGTFSTTGIAIIIAAYLIKLAINKKPLRAIFIGVIMVIVVLYTPYIGLNAKSATHSQSVNDRTYAITVGLEKLSNNLIGEGFYSTDPSDLPNAGISLLGMSYKIGVIGVLLVIFAYFIPMYKYRGWKNYLICISPLFLTGLLSQPILDAPMVYIMFLADYTPIQDLILVHEKSKVKPFLKKKIKFRKIVW